MRPFSVIFKHRAWCKILWKSVIFFLLEKARILEKAGAKGGIVVDNNKGTTSANSPLFSMSGDGTDDISIPMVFLFSNDAKSLIETLQAGHRVDVNLLDSLAGKLKTFLECLQFCKFWFCRWQQQQQCQQQWQWEEFWGSSRHRFTCPFFLGEIQKTSRKLPQRQV